MKKKIIPIVALVLTLSMVMSVSAFAAESVDDIALIEDILNDGCKEVNALIGKYAMLINEGEEGGTWSVQVKIIDQTTSGSTVYRDILDTLVAKLNEHSGELKSFAPANDPEAAITLNGDPVEDSQVVKFVLALGLTNKEGEPFSPSMPIGELIGDSFIAVITTQSGAQYYWDVYFE